MEKAALEERLAEMAALTQNWDSYRGVPIDPGCIERARPMHDQLDALGLAPFPVPISHGGIMFERFSPDDYSVDLNPDGTADVWIEDRVEAEGLTDEQAINVLRQSYHKGDLK